MIKTEEKDPEVTLYLYASHAIFKVYIKEFEEYLQNRIYSPVDLDIKLTLPYA